MRPLDWGKVDQEQALRPVDWQRVDLEGYGELVEVVKTLEARLVLAEGTIRRLQVADARRVRLIVGGKSAARELDAMTAGVMVYEAGERGGG